MQANIVRLDSIYFKPRMVDKYDGSVNYILEYFSGFKSIKNENHLISLSGVNFENFNVFLTCIHDQNYSKKTKEDRLLLSLVKLGKLSKLTYSFYNISVEPINLLYNSRTLDYSFQLHFEHNYLNRILMKSKIIKTNLNLLRVSLDMDAT